jgi:cardiolipin synthase
MTQATDVPLEDALAERRRHRRHQLERLLGVPFIARNRIERLRNGDAIFAAMLEAVGRAEHTVDFLTFNFWGGPTAERFVDAFVERAQAGVTVRVLLDTFGAWAIPRALVRQMRAGGVDVAWFRPPRPWHPYRMTRRTHRKVLVVDNQVAFTGGVGIGEPWAGDARGPDEWRDSHFRLDGPAVAGVEGAFWGNWLETRDEGVTRVSARPPPAPAGDAAVMVVRPQASVGWNDASSLLWGLCEVAERRLAITTPYFAPDVATRRALKNAAARGVDVNILMPGPYLDSSLSVVAAHEAQTRLVDLGVRLWEYQPTMIHLKQILVDDDLLGIGSVNLNERSRRRDDEIALLVEDTDLAATLWDDFFVDVADSGEVTASTLRARGWPRRLAAAALRPFRHEV